MDCTLEVAGLAVSCEGVAASELCAGAPAWEPFARTGGPGAGAPPLALRLRIVRTPPPPLAGAALLFDSGGAWRLWRTAAHLALGVFLPGHATPLRLALLAPDWTSGVLYWPRGVPGGPLDYPLSELLWLHLLARAGGLLVHGAGLTGPAGGLLAAGNSGHGKTTLARLWLAAGRGGQLNDDRCAVRCRADGVWLHGTPWHGESPLVAAGPVPLVGLYFLRQAARDRLAPCEGRSAVSALLSRSFVPHWDAAALARSLAACQELCARVPVAWLDFRPTPDALSLLPA